MHQGIKYRTIWVKDGDIKTVQIIDQRYLPYQYVVEDITNVEQACVAIKDMHTRGAGVIGILAAYGMYLGLVNYRGEYKNIHTYIEEIAKKIKSTRPTAINLMWAVDRVVERVKNLKTVKDMIEQAFDESKVVADLDAFASRQIGKFGLEIIEEISKRKKGDVVNILTHCNAGWLALVDHGTATAPMYLAKEKGIKIHVYVDETRPRNQGASLTAWELGREGVPHTVIPDNVGGHLMQHGLVDMVIVGSDRTTRNGDVCNKIGTYLKALAAWDNKVPFYAALPSSTFDFSLNDGLKQIPIEERDATEVSHIQGLHEGTLKTVQITPHGSHCANYGFDVTPAKYVTGIITERGICAATEQAITQMFPEAKKFC